MTAGAWPNTIAPDASMERFHWEGDLESIDLQFLPVLAARVGVLVEEEKQYPDLIRTRLQRNALEGT